jgi:hypothetical protein
MSTNMTHEIKNLVQASVLFIIFSLVSFCINSPTEKMPVPVVELASPPVDWEAVLTADPGGFTQGLMREESLNGLELINELFGYARSMADRGNLNILVLVPAEMRTIQGLGLYGTTEEMLYLVAEATEGAVWQLLDHGIVYCFGTEADLQRLRSEVPTTLPPILVQAESPVSMLMLLQEFWHLKITVEPEWLLQSETSIRGPFPEKREDTIVWSVSQKKSASLSSWMEKVATSLGGEIDHTGSQWVFRQYVDGFQLRRSAKQLLAELRQKIHPFATEEAIILARLSEPAIPILEEALNPAEPVLARVIIFALGEIRSRHAVDTLLAALEWPVTLHNEHYPNVEIKNLRNIIVEALGKIGDERALSALQKLLANEQITPSLEQTIRVALGNIAPKYLPEENFSATVQCRPNQMKLNLVEKAHDTQIYGFGDEQEIQIQRLWQDEKGEWWAAFFFARYGNESDIWIAHSHDGQSWRDYLFTGCTLAQHQARGAEAQILDFKVSQGTIYLTWNRPKEKAQYVKLSLAELRRDSDGDNLTDVLEKRLQTDPFIADTDRDSLNDGEDGNPLVAQQPQPSDEQKIIQIAFAHLYRHDPSMQIKIVTIFGLDKQGLYGYSGPILCMTREEKAKFQEEVGCGPEFVSFISYDGIGDERTETSPVMFTNDGQTARVEVSTYRDGLWGAGYHGILKKVDDRWILVDWQMNWIS